jgi:hypothetical protein
MMETEDVSETSETISVTLAISRGRFIGYF